jgi:CDP-glucose 4,6-dehydratase
MGTRPKPMLDSAFWTRRLVFVTGHTGFKGAWLVAMLRHLGADVHGYALVPDTDPNLFDLAGIADICAHHIGDVRDGAKLSKAVADFAPEIVLHLAAQSLVRWSYREPVETFETNILGTANVLEACREVSSVKAVVNVTTDKCYENKNQEKGYIETDRLGGNDPYSASKACSEMLTNAYRNSFFPSGGYADHGVALASARAGNVIGGGDWCEDRIVPDAVRSFSSGETLIVRSPDAVRPWQHVLDPLSGYLLLAQQCVEHGTAFAKGWNFGPGTSRLYSVGALVEELVKHWPEPVEWKAEASPDDPPEATTLVLDSGLAADKLGWQARVGFADAIALTAEWYIAHQGGATPGDLRLLMDGQISNHLSGEQPETNQ